MKILYLECGMGCAGDILMGALSELTDVDAFLEIMNHCGLEGVTFEPVKSVKCGITGTHMKVLVKGQEEHAHHHDHEHHHHHAGLHDIEEIIRNLRVSENVKKNAMEIYLSIAEAEAHVHNASTYEVHFHEVGMLDAIADVVGNCVLMEMIHPDKVVTSSIALGSGTVRCMHGEMPVPAPATAYLMKGMPVYSSEEKGELLTPTGCALLKHFTDTYGEMPRMISEGTGYGMGNKDFAKPNCVRAFLGTKENDGSVAELVCSIDDMTGEELGFATEQLFKEGALDVYTTPIVMKKSRPGTLLTCMCREPDKERITKAVFRLTTTLGIREYTSRRYTLSRSIETVQTPFGEVRRKDVNGYGVQRSKYEYEDLAQIAKEKGMSVMDVRNALKDTGDK